MKIKKGTNRLAIILKTKVIKIPLGTIGLFQNRQEYINYSRSKNKNLIADTKLYKNKIIVQERLFNTEIYPLTIKSCELPDYAIPLFNIRLISRLQIGQDKNNNWKIFDYEDVKYLLNQLGWR